MKYLILVVAFAASSFNLEAQNDSSELARVGQAAPDFRFEIEKGKTAKLSDYKGKVVIVNFFATWCGPCRAELPELHERIYLKHKDDPNFALFIFGREEDWDVVLPFKNANKFMFPMLPDANRKIFSLYATQYIPRTLLIDKTGKIVYTSMGYSEEEFKKLEKKVNALLN